MTTAKETLKVVVSKAQTFLERLETHQGVWVSAAFRRSLADLEKGKAMETEALKEICWEQLHTGHWEDVSMEWRNAYALAQCLHGYGLIEADNEAAALKELDLGLMMGADAFRSELEALIRSIKPSTNKRSLGSMESSSKKRKISEMLPWRSLERPIGRSPSKKTSPSIEAFCSEFMGDVSAPCILEGLIRDWPAFEKWHRLEYFLERWGHRTVPVEIGRHYLSDEWGQRMMTFEDFLTHHIVPTESVHQVGYLAQHPLFDQIPELKADIRIPEYCYLGTEKQDPVINAWFGPGGTVSPLHYDRSHNILCQVVGRKYIRLYAPECSSVLLPMSSSMNKNSSQIDLDDVDQIKRSGLEETGFVDAVVEAGDALFIPRGWWHYVRSLDISFSVSFWWN